ncbi:MAG: NAD/NADP octopine/nopaline dehydrogenase family protein [Bacteroidales bacterium]|nr:NAD/NADP octopine/nopaline dehydrogenase family protein [Bacteroidales bacterium]
MAEKLNILVVGGGNLGHAIYGKAAQNKYINVSLLTSRPNLWASELKVYEEDGSFSKVKMLNVSDSAEEIVPNADLIILTIPSFLIRNTLIEIEPLIKTGAWVGSIQCSGGYFWMAQSILPKGTKIFGFQRVPFISRIREYGSSVNIKGYKKQLKIATNKSSDNDHTIINNLKKIFNTPTIKLKSFLEVTLTNSNPILHPSRLYDLFKNISLNKNFRDEPLFYEEWSDNASNILIKCDDELADIVRALNNKMDPIPSILKHYGVDDSLSLTIKLRSIAAFKGIRLGLSKVSENTFRIDLNNRYFTEDIPFGLLIIKGFAEQLKIETPMIDEIILWAQNLMGKEYLIDNRLIGKDVCETGIPQNFDFKV